MKYHNPFFNPSSVGKTKNRFDHKLKRGMIFHISEIEDSPKSTSVQLANRPAVIVSNNRNNIYSETVEVVFLTTRSKTNLPTHVKIKVGSNKQSTVLCEQVQTVSKKQLVHFLGKVEKEKMQEIDKAILISLGLDYLI